MFLLPGDSPMGFRLPLDSLPWYVNDDTTPWQERDPLVPRSPWLFPADAAPTGSGPWSPGGYPAADSFDGNWASRPAYAYATVHKQMAGAAPAAKLFADTAGPTLRESPVAAIAEPTSQTIRTCLCVEPRDGRMHVFMPPFARLEDYLRMVEAIEDTAEELGMPVMIEGYTPPHDHRLQHFKVTPDPGVIEVNRAAAQSWNELVDNTTTLYEEARRSAAGNRKVHGRRPALAAPAAATTSCSAVRRPADSPFLRRPDLLRSLVAYWNNHPSLSYLFSGLFVGPTSQAPRIDEARHDSLYELEIAFQQCREGTTASLARRSSLPPSADRSDGQHAPCGVLHRQALFARFGLRSAGAGRVPQFRDAAARADEPDAATSASGAGGPFLGESPTGNRWSAGARRCTTALCCRTSSSQDFLDVLGEMREWGLPTGAGVVRAALRVPLSLARRGQPTTA